MLLSSKCIGALTEKMRMSLFLRFCKLRMGKSQDTGAVASLEALALFTKLLQLMAPFLTELRPAAVAGE